MLVDSLLQSDWLMQLVYDFRRDGDELIAFSYRNRLTAYADAMLTARGKVVASDSTQVEIPLRIINAAVDMTTREKGTV